jgi:hypothetical protein
VDMRYARRVGCMCTTLGAFLFLLPAHAVVDFGVCGFDPTSSDCRRRDSNPLEIKKIKVDSLEFFFIIHTKSGSLWECFFWSPW